MIGATQILPDDRYPFAVVGVGEGKARLRRCKLVSLKTGHKPAYHAGPFPVWNHSYSREEIDSLSEGGEEILVEQKIVNGDACWFDEEGIEYIMGYARYYRDYSD